MSCVSLLNFEVFYQVHLDEHKFLISEGCIFKNFGIYIINNNIGIPGLDMHAPGPSASVAKPLHFILSLRSPGKTLAQLFINSVQKSRHGKIIFS